MKRIVQSLCVFIAIVNSTTAQIPNNGFESWSSYGNGMTLDGWWCSNDSINPGNSYFPVTRSSDHFPASVGSYSIRLECNPLLPTWTGFGLAWPGTYDGGERPSFPVTGHPNTLCGYYKYFPQNGDMMNIRWILYKNGGAVTGGEILNGNTANEWTAFVIQLADNSYLTADSARITISPFDWNGPMLGNSVLYVDNLSFDNIITSTPQHSDKSMEINVFPNPASDIISVSLKLEGRVTMKVLDASGKLVFLQNETFPTGGGIVSIPLSGLTPGIYLLRIQDEQENGLSKKFIKK